MTRGRTLWLAATLAGLLGAQGAWAACGDGTVDGGEECDLGAGNGLGSTCCTTLCEFRAAGNTCRGSGGSCDIVETCSGTDGDCPPDEVRPSNFICRGLAGGCDVAETCDGIGPTCPADDVQDAGLECRDEVGPCDASEVCDGVDTACPPDLKVPAGTNCRIAGGDCDDPEDCDGVNDACPPDQLSPPTTVCRPAQSACDAAELCTGFTTLCPPDIFLPNDTPCNDASACTNDDVCFQGVCVGTQDLDACIDDFMCYKTQHPRFTPLTNVQLVDQFETGPVTVTRPKHLCAPADKNMQGTVNPAIHLRSYSIRTVARHQPRTNILVENQLGPLRVDTQRADLLLVPTSKSLTGPTTPPDPMTHDVDHYKCYRVRVTPGAARFPDNVTVTVTDQFGTAPRTVRLKKVRHLCNPVDKNGEGIKNQGGHLLCYLARGRPRPAKTSGVNTANQFGTEVLSRGSEAEFCIPSETTVPP